MTQAPLRVAVDARSLLCAQPRGEGKSLLRLYEEIARLRPDIQVTMFGDDHAARFKGSLPPGARQVAFSALTHRVDVWENLLLPWRARAMGCNVLHAASSGTPGWAPLPVVMTVHDLIPLVFDDGHDAASRARFAARLDRGVRRARRIVTVSDSTRRDLLARHPGAAARTQVIHWGGDPLQPACEPQAAPWLLLFGGEARRKNTEYSVQRFVAAASRVPGLRLRVIGVVADAQRRALGQMLEAAGLAERADILGFVTEAALQAHLRSATALLYLSLYEGFGLPLLEAIGMGLPVIASDRSSLPEVLQGAPGLHSLEDPAAIEDTIVRLCSDAGARAAYALAQQAVLPRFSWSDTASHYIHSFEAAAWAGSTS